MENGAPSGLWNMVIIWGILWEKRGRVLRMGVLREKLDHFATGVGGGGFVWELWERVWAKRASKIWSSEDGRHGLAPETGSDPGEHLPDPLACRTPES